MQCQINTKVYKMDIVTRLKEFINHESVAITQFADNCRIPRPTLSQLLNGRNKKVSDELIGKIHEAYPQLSVLWLMFGEGTMLHEEKIETSEPQKAPVFTFGASQQSDFNEITPQIDFEKNFSENEANSAENISEGIPGLNSTPIDVTAETNIPSDSKSAISFNPYAKKRIVNIIVYYDDNSFESFVPGQRK